MQTQHKLLVNRLLRSCVVVVIAVVGCGPRHQNVYPVIGQVTLDNTPLADAEIMFIPVKEGRPSSGVTDSNGMYQLQYTYRQKGAEHGMHSVRVTTAHTREDGSVGPERVPPKYNRNTTLTKEVVQGSNTIDLNLTGQNGAAAKNATNGE